MPGGIRILKRSEAQRIKPHTLYYSSVRVPCTYINAAGWKDKKTRKQLKVSTAPGSHMFLEIKIFFRTFPECRSFVSIPAPHLVQVKGYSLGLRTNQKKSWKYSFDSSFWFNLRLSTLKLTDNHKLKPPRCR